MQGSYCELKDESSKNYEVLNHMVDMEKYFEEIEQNVKKAYKIAANAKKKG